MNIGKPGPFQVIHSVADQDVPSDPPKRRYDCAFYELCLNVAAALNWDSFTCRGCSGTFDEQLLWRAHQASKNDGVVGKLCDLPELKQVVGWKKN
ncbi:MAG TPA: hypothetical protein PKD37_03865 [Oligoflexia bacterium]|nr:hypothetical protein [Oligoflexia bacterium]HMP27104.1 hypothetical protein [Oligoflexia bacterium]